MHPRRVLFGAASPLPNLPACVHYAGNEKFIQKALSLQETAPYGFDITADCEDGAEVGREAVHAEMVLEQLRSAANRKKRMGVRIHDLRSRFWQSELNLFLRGAGELLSYLVIPKVESLTQFTQFIHFLRFRVRELGLSRVPPLHVIIESSQAVEDCFQIAAFPEVETLDFGLLDFISAQGGAIPSTCMQSPGQFQHHLLIRAKTRIVQAALMHKAIPAHNITLSLRDHQAVFLDAKQAREEFGFLRMWSIHPGQIAPIVEAMLPSYAELSRGQEILLAAWRNAWGPISFKNELHDRASYRYFWQVLERARASGLRLEPEIEKTFFSGPS